jgi:hypothetical protein
MPEIRLENWLIERARDPRSGARVQRFAGDADDHPLSG